MKTVRGRCFPATESAPHNFREAGRWKLEVSISPAGELIPSLGSPPASSFSKNMSTHKTIIILVVIAAALLGAGVTIEILGASSSGFCGSAPCGLTGQKLDLVYYLFEESGSQSTPLGVYLGTYAQTLQYCQTYHLSGSTLLCNEPADISRGSGYGLLYLVYPGCGSGVCYMVPEIRLAIPEGSGTSWNWKVYKLSKADGVTGHGWTEISSLGNVDLTVRSSLADFGGAPYISD